MKHPYILALLLINVLGILLAWWAGREDTHTAPDDLMGGAFVAVMVIVLLVLSDAVVAGALLIHWMVRG